ncbi:MAG: ion transporter [Gemmatimonadota bacterium]|nr:MAG: ion transporter [Gemmatimonadota bacterium]
MIDVRPPQAGWRARWHEIIFEADTPAGKAFDVSLLLAILLSVTAVLLESVAGVRALYGPQLRAIEWFFTVLFSVEYIARLATVGRPMRYALSFFGMVDLLAVVPTYLSVMLPGAQSLIVIRALRLLRVFRVLKLVQFVGEARIMRTALRASMRKIIVFLGAVLTLVLIIGAVMYLVEGEEHGFTNIPESIYWAIVTMTTVGYGDIAPGTVVGRMLASVVMIIGYGIIAVPTGIVTVEMATAARRPISTQVCSDCSGEGHDPDAAHCKYCGARL